VDLRTAVAQHYGNPKGPLGHLVGRLMARGNSGFNAWLVAELGQRLQASAVRRVLELGHGPGVGLERLLTAFPDAEARGLEQSPAMVAQAARRNRTAIADGRLRLERGDATEAGRLGPFDLVAAVHVIYFWPDPTAPLAALRAALAPGGTLAIGMLLRADMPRGAREQFPKLATRLYDSDEDVRAQLAAAGFDDVDVVVKPDAPGRNGRLVLARAVEGRLALARA
jgi:SAM-dependent methyltransferase